MHNFDLPGRYLRENFAREDRLAVVLIDHDSREVKQKLATAEKIASPRFQAYLRAENAKGKDVYTSMNTVAPEATGRTKAHIETIRHLYLDVDVGGRAALDNILSAAGIPNPHHVLNTSPDKFQVIWSVEGYDKQAAERTLRGMAAQYGADSAATDCSRVLRLPGFRNWKYEKPHYVKDVHAFPGERTYGPGDFPAYEMERHVSLPPVVRPHSGESGKGSQSERDWSYALRALARGESPAVIEAKIEQFRQDRRNPQYYAHLTVSRAVVEHSSTRSRQPGSARLNSTEWER